MKTLGTLFSGFGGFDMGAHAAGLQSAWGIEYDDAIADVARMNGLPVMTANVLDVDPRTLEWVNWLHASPPCPNFSQAKAGRAESELDLALAAKVAEFVTVIKPDVFSLENVRAYEKSASFKAIVDALFDAGYWPQWSVENSADYGVPQTRERLILRATRGTMPPSLPEPVRWVGWYEAIEDIIDTLPESKFADWQLKRLPAEMQTVMIGGGNRSNAFLEFAKLNRPDTPGKRFANQPSHLVTATGSNDVRAFLVDSLNAGRELTTRFEEQPSYTVISNHMRRLSSTPSAWLSQGRVVQMTPRALARFQSFPDSYKLPDNKSLACKGIGNAVPSLLAQRIVEATL